MHHTGANMESVKKQNRTSVLKYIIEAGSVSRKDIADATNLTSAAVTYICNEFMEEGILIETGEHVAGAGAGRRKVMVNINYDFCHILAITIEPEETVIALSNLKGELAGKISRKTKQVIDVEIEPEEFLISIAQDCSRLLAENAHGIKNVAGVSVAISGLVDAAGGVSKKAYGIWEKEVPVAEILSEKLGLPVIVENNVNAFAMAELLFGIGKKYDNLIVIKWGPGVGATIIIDHNVYEGSYGKAAEIGHFIVQKDGKMCSCGRRGCLETIVSYQALSQNGSFMMDEFGAVYKKAKAEKKEQSFNNAIDIFARTIVNFATVLTPNRVILSGKMFREKEVRDKMIACCKQYDKNYDEKRIIYTALPEKEDYIGAVAAFMMRKFLNS